MEGPSQEAKMEKETSTRTVVKTYQPPGPIAPAPSPEEETLRKEFTDLIVKLLTKSNELAFELATVECDKANQCDVCKKAKELIRVVKDIVKLQRKITSISR